MRGLLAALAVGLVVVAGATASTGFGDGSLDAAFAGGKTQTQVGLDGSSASGVAVQPDGKVVAFGQSDYALGQTGVTLLRYLRNGSLDPSFGKGGVVQTPIGTTNDEAFDGFVQPDGKLVAVGTTRDAIKQNFAVVRYLPDGELDSTFGNGGIVTTSVGDASFGNELALRAALQPDGKIVAAGTAALSDDAAIHTVVVRYLANGALDPTFGAGGVFTLGLPNVYLQDVALQSNGGILLATTNGLKRLLPDGTLDTAFAPPQLELPDALAVAPDGSIFANSSVPGGVGLARLLPTGQIDTSWGTAGMATVHFDPAPSSTLSTSIVVQPDGKPALTATLIYKVDGSTTTAHPDVIRFTQTGSLDPSFGDGGIVSTLFDWARAFYLDSALAPDGRLVAVGATIDPSVPTSDVVAVSYLTDTVAPTCAPGAASANGGRAMLTVSFADGDTGLASITGGASVGATITVPAFAPGAGSVSATAVQTEAGRPALVSLSAADRADNSVSCTEEAVVVTRGKGNKRIDVQTLTNVPAALATLTLTNGPDRLRDLGVTVNGTSIDVPLRAAGAPVTVDLAPYLHAGATNTVELAPEGKVGASVVAVLH